MAIRVQIPMNCVNSQPSSSSSVASATLGGCSGHDVRCMKQVSTAAHVRPFPPPMTDGFTLCAKTQQKCESQVACAKVEKFNSRGGTKTKGLFEFRPKALPCRALTCP